MAYEIKVASKLSGQTLRDARVSLVESFPEFLIQYITQDDDQWIALLEENISERTANKYIKKRGDEWVIVQKGTGKTLSTHDSQEKAEASFRAMEFHKHEGAKGGLPSFLKNKGEEDKGEEESDKPGKLDLDDDSSEGSDEEEMGEKEEGDEEEESENGKEPKGKSKEKGKSKDPVGEMHKLLEELLKLVDSIGGKAQEVGDQSDEHSQKLDDIKNLVGDKGEAPGRMPSLKDEGPTPDEIGPVPGGGPAGGPPPPPNAPMPRPPARGLDRRKAPIPGGGGLNAFTKRRTEIASIPTIDSEGNPISFSTAIKALELSEEFEDYKVASIKTEGDMYYAKLELKSE